ncbi:MAG TPA: formyltetrahydrofolate deformylase [Burkholderiaceae bacterium]|nr:formyltetrahydrofolate deformylase [Burkholderiaceae bacterium]HQR75749.1 formyltetrahydrofolate deformylase [Burkholderiaceae bacterium]
MEPLRSIADTRTATLLLHCELRAGLAADLTRFVQANGGRIVYHEQYVDNEIHRYYTRLQWELANFAVPDGEIGAHVEKLAGGGHWSLRLSDCPQRMAVFVSKEPWCLYDILARSYSGEWPVEIPVIVANHPDLKPVADRFGIAFHVLPMTADNKTEVEQAQLALLAEHRIDLVVLAKYMQIVTERFVRAYESRIINIHHAFLPAFPGARPYHSAHARGVKMIGATAHYVTEALDAGPIIEQDVMRVTHRDTVQDLVRSGRDIEKIVLSRAIWSHLQNKIIVHNGRTIVFH